MNNASNPDPTQNYVSAWRSQLDRRIAEANAMPDLADVYDRARLMDPERFTEQNSDEVAFHCPNPADATLVEFYQDWKAQLDVKCDQVLHDHNEVLEIKRPSHHSNWKHGFALTLSIAAAVAGIWFLPQFQNLGPMLRSQPVEMQHSVNLVDRPAHRQHSYVKHFTPVQPSLFDEPIPQNSNPASFRSSDISEFFGRLRLNRTTGNLPLADSERKVVNQAERSLGKSRVERTKSREARLHALDQKARDFWKQGDVEQARKTFVRLTRIGGSSKLAELAFGDLFALTRQQADPHKTRSLWKQYLQRFPNGVFAQDARAGLCRHRKSEGLIQACWQEYLQKHPKGAHRVEAKLQSRIVASDKN